MKIAFISTYTNGWAGKASLRLARALEETGQTVSVFVAENQGDNVLLVRQIRHRYIFFMTYFLERCFFMFYEMSKKVRWLFSPALFWVNISKSPVFLDIDIIHLHWINHGFLSLKNIAQLQKLWKPIVWTLHDMWVFTWGCHHSGGCTKYKTWCGNCWFLKAPKNNDLSARSVQKKKELYHKKPLQFVSCSKWLHNLASSSLLLSKYPITVIPNPIDTNIFRPQRSVLEIRKNLGLPTNKKLLLFVAEHLKSTYKGLDYLVWCLKNFNDYSVTPTDLELVIVGKANKDLFNQLNIPFHYLGFVQSEEQMAKIYWVCDIFVAPSLEDNLPNTIMESMACGTPVLAFDTWWITEMITHLNHGYVARHKDVDDLFKGLLWILNNSPLQHQMLRSNCIKKVQNLYTYKTIAEQYKAVYDRALKEQEEDEAISLENFKNL